MQGYGLDGMAGEELSTLIGLLTQAVERVRITVQLRQLHSLRSGGSKAASPQSAPEADTASTAALSSQFSAPATPSGALRASSFKDLTVGRVERGLVGKPSFGRTLEGYRNAPEQPISKLSHVERRKPSLDMHTGPDLLAIGTSDLL